MRNGLYMYLISEILGTIFENKLDLDSNCLSTSSTGTENALSHFIFFLVCQFIGELESDVAIRVSSLHHYFR